MPTINATPTSERAKLLSSFFMSLACKIIDGETLGVFLRIFGIEDSVDQLHRRQVHGTVLYTQLLHRFQINVGPQNLSGDLLIIRRARYHSPAPELAEPPVTVSARREIAVALGIDHVVRILFLSPVAVVVLSLQAVQNDFFRTVNVGGARDDLGNLRSI